MAVLFRWKPDLPASSLPRETLWSAMTAGLRYIAMSPNIEKVLLRSFVFGFSTISILALLPLVARDLPNGGPLLYGVMLGAFGCGAIGGAFLSSRLRKLTSAEWIVRSAFVGFALCGRWWPPPGARCWRAWRSPSAAPPGCWRCRSSTSPCSSRRLAGWWGGRSSLYQTATFGGMALGSWVWGVAAEAYGAERALLAAAVIMLLGAVIGLGIALPEETTLNLDPLNRWKEPPLALDLKPRSGPIVIMIEYTIREEDMAPFLEAMAERRRMRGRNGARNWTLSRDLENPRVWMEIYHLPTWVEYRRHNLSDHLCRPGGGRPDQGASQRQRAAAGAPHDRAADQLVRHAVCDAQHLRAAVEQMQAPGRGQGPQVPSRLTVVAVGRARPIRSQPAPRCDWRA